MNSPITFELGNCEFHHIICVCVRRRKRCFDFTYLPTRERKLSLSVLIVSVCVHACMFIRFLAWAWQLLPRCSKLFQKWQKHVLAVYVWMFYLFVFSSSPLWVWNVVLPVTAPQVCRTNRQPNNFTKRKSLVFYKLHFILRNKNTLLNPPASHPFPGLLSNKSIFSRKVSYSSCDLGLLQSWEEPSIKMLPLDDGSRKS